MAISISLCNTETNLFCASKWWGSPDMPHDMHYPTETVTDEEGSWECPLTFLCQINCEDIAALDKDNLLPHEGMLYFFVSSMENTPRKTVVKYTAAVNMETFESFILCDDDGNETGYEPLKINFSGCPDDEPGLRLLGKDPDYPDCTTLLQVQGESRLCIMMTDNNLAFRNWGRSFGITSR